MEPAMRALPSCLLMSSVLLLAGCLEAGEPPLGTGHDSLVAPREQVLAAFGAIPPPDFDRSSAVQVWEDFLADYPKRDYLLPHNADAAAFLQAELTRAGYFAETMYLPYSGYVPRTEVSQEMPTYVRVVRGVLEGSDPTHRFALVAHYDTTQTTIQGAYDDGAGTIAELEICKLLAAAREVLQHTIECLFFDAEEEGLVASRAFVNWYKEVDRGFVYDLVFGYDMTGINWPGHNWKLYAMIGADHPELGELRYPFTEFLEVGLYDFFDTNVITGAKEGIEILGIHDRNSDEMSFKKAGIPVVRFAGGRNASDYPGYHRPNDLVPYVYQFVGGRANFEKGYEAVILSSYYTILGFDKFNPRDLPVG